MTPAAIIKLMERVEMSLYGGTPDGWVCERIFIERTGLDTKQKRYEFRKDHPELIQVNDKGKFIYDLPGYFKLFKKIA